ncbi:Hydra magnipapillata [Seminavis robusta]|uniref:Hydra magnipapillata n=1 Tax=Seminavis robusta TaxID=568900 RepID=A0A9N8EMN5_9STRA|nr:Hydra magnipapillata [Seminavis robusta]|eukprot:Sro1474_g275710.1 Hydra magnipapillata (750) ;mRNA; f:8773-11022
MHSETTKQSDEQMQKLDMLGVSVFHLEHLFLQEVCTSTGNPLSRDSKIHEIENLRGPPGVIRNKGTNTVCPIDGKEGAAYVHCLQGEDHVGEATQMLSYSWNYTIGDIVDTLSDYCLQNKLNPKRTYIWMCCLCVNQHRVVQKSTQQKSGMVPTAKVDFFAIFGERVKKIGHLLAMMAPWNAPVYITRVWCIFEIFTAHITDGCKIDIVMPPKEKLSLEQDVVDTGGGVNALYETLCNTKVEKANASVDSDRLAILGQVKSDVGYSVLNNLVNDLLRGWIQGVLTQLVRARENTNNMDYVCFCTQIGKILLHNGENDSAMELHQNALTICETVLGKNHERTADTHSDIGAVLYKMGDCEGALSKYKEALDIRLSRFDKNHCDVALAYNDMGLVLNDMGDYEGALTKYNEALAIQKSVLGEEHKEVATSYNNLGIVLGSMGDYAGSLEKHKEALAILMSALGKNHPRVAFAYNGIGSALHGLGEYEGALRKHKQALAIRLLALGKNHSLVASSCINIGSALSSMGDYEGALSNYEEALAIKLSALGKNHPDVATTYVNIGRVLDEMGNYEGALAKYEEGLAIGLSALGKNHPFVAITYNSIGDVLCAKADYERALAKHKEALAIQLSALGKNHPGVAGSYSCIGTVLQLMGDYEGALTEYEKALAISLSALGKNHPNVAAAYDNIGAVLAFMGNHSGALLKFEESLAIWEPLLGADHPNTKDCLEWIEDSKKELQKQSLVPELLHGKSLD